MDGQEEYVSPGAGGVPQDAGHDGDGGVVADRLLAAQLYQRGVSVSVIENAFVLAATRRLVRPADAPRWVRFARLPISCLSSRKCWRRTSARSIFQHVRRKLERIARER